MTAENEATIFCLLDPKLNCPKSCGLHEAAKNIQEETAQTFNIPIEEQSKALAQRRRYR